jgi:PAS domain S-box-containing protein
VELGTSSIRHISEASGVPRPDTYGVLDQLKSLGLIQKVLAKPTMYKSLPLDTIVAILVGRQEEQRIQLNKKAEKLLNNFAEKVIQEKANTDGKLILLSSRESFAHQLIKTIKNCQNSICLMTSKKALARYLALYSDSLKQAQKNGISLKVITDKPFDDSQSRRPFGIQKMGNAEIRYLDIYPIVAFAIFDNKEIMLLAEDQAYNSENEVVWSNHRSILELATNFFNDAWFGAKEPPEKEFKRDRLQFDHLFDNMPASFAYCRIILNRERKPIDFIILQVNEAFKAINGVDPLHVTNKKATELFSEAHKSNPELFDLFGRVACTGTREQFEVFFHPLNIWIAGTAYSPKRGYFATLFWDVTKRKEAEKKVREEERKALNYLNVVGNIVLALDLQHRIILLNKKGYEILGYKGGELQGKDWIEVALPPECREELTNVFVDWVNGKSKTPEIYENPIITKNGQSRIISWHNTELRDESGNLVGTLSSGEDITERKEAIDALARSEQRFRVMADGSPIILWISNTKGETIFVNRTYKEFFGVTEIAAVGAKWKPLVYPDDASEYIRKYFQALKEQKAFVAQARVRRHDGAWRWIDSHGEPYFSSNSEFLGHIGVTIDITERKEAEQALKSSEEKYREMINSMNDAAWVIDKSAKFIEVNKAAERYLGYSRTELLSMSVSDIDKKVDPQTVTKLHRKALADDCKVFETTHTTKDGRQIPVEISLSKVSYQGKEAILSIVRDITQRKKAGEALKLSEEKYYKLFENSSDAIMLTKPDGTILAANPQACKMLQMNEDELRNAGRQGIVVTDDQLNNALRERQLFGHGMAQLTFRRKDGTTFSAEVSSSVFTDNDGIVKTSMIIREKALI